MNYFTTTTVRFVFDLVFRVSVDVYVYFLLVWVGPFFTHRLLSAARDFSPDVAYWMHYPLHIIRIMYDTILHNLYTIQQCILFQNFKKFTPTSVRKILCDMNDMKILQSKIGTDLFCKRSMQTITPNNGHDGSDPPRWSH